MKTNEIDVCPLGSFIKSGIVLVCIIFLAGSAFGGAAPIQRSVAHYYCYSVKQPSTFYFSSVFSTADNPLKVEQVFQKFLAQKYAYQAQATPPCFGNHPTLAAARTEMQKMMAQLRTKNKVIETGWTYSGAVPATSESSGAQDSSTEASAAEDGASGMSVPSEAAASGSGQPMTPAEESSQSAVAAGTEVAVRMAEAVDSGRDAPGRQYRAFVLSSVEAGNGATIQRGSPAMIVLVKNQTGWEAQLRSVMVNGQSVSVSSNPASLMRSAQSEAASAMNSVTSALGNFHFGHHSHAPAVVAMASGDRVVLPPGTQLKFALNSMSSGGTGGGVSMAGMAQPMGASPSNVPNTTAVATGGALKAKISEVLLGPSPTKAGNKYVVSPDGGHYAAFAMHGSRELIVIDGVEGPEFDHAGHAYTYGQIDVVFTKDGKHSAYIGQRGDSLIAVVDGKPRATIEQLKKGAGMGELQGINTALDYPPTVSNQAPNQLHPILLSPNGLHYACIAYNDKGGSNMVLDGVKGPDMMSIDRDQIAFVNEQLIYVGTTPDRKRHVVINNKLLGPEYEEVRYLRVTEDAKHYAFAAQKNGEFMVVVDGKPGTPRKFVTWMQDLVFSSNGRPAFMASVAVKAPVEGNEQVLFVDDREVARGVRAFATIDWVGNPVSSVYVIFSLDGTKYAYTKVVPGGVAAVIAGKAGRAYDSIGLVQFSQDSRHAYFVGQRGQSFVVVDGREMPGVNRMDDFIFSNDGMHFAYLAYMQDGNHVVVDGKESPRYYNFIAHSLAFSPDSKHYVYAACTNIMKCQVVRDGNTTNLRAVSQFSARTLRPAYVFPPVFFSPDSTRVAYSYAKSDGTAQSVYIINGQEEVHGTSFEFPSFSPDSRHFFVMGWNGHGYTVFGDGKEGPDYKEIIEANLNSVRFETPHTYRFLGIKNDSVYRVTVDLTNMN